MTKNRPAKLKDAGAALAFIGPLALVLFVFLILPIVKAIGMSFQYWHAGDVSSAGNSFVGFENYATLFSDIHFLNSAAITVLYITVTVIARYLLGFAAALLLNRHFRFRGLARSLLIIPYAIPEVVACLIWLLMYDKDGGIISHVLNMGYLQDSSTALWAAMAVNIWKGFPFVAIMLLAALQNIPNELYETASIDGANARQKLLQVSIPGIWSVSKVVFLFLVIWTAKDYVIAYCLTQGGPERSTEILTIFVQQTAFKYLDFGKAAAAGVVLLVLSIIFTSVYFGINRSGEAEE